MIIMEDDHYLEYKYHNPVSYTHLDVYKRQALWGIFPGTKNCLEKNFNSVKKKEQQR